MPKIVLTGGGTAGHVTPNLALMPKLKEHGFDVFYIGSYDGIEKSLIEPTGTPYLGISSGKLRRYHDWKNFTDPFRVLKGIREAKQIMRNEKPSIIFSKGGFVSVPVSIAARRLRIPLIIHESDCTPGLANKLAFPFANKVCCNFPETVKYLPKGKGVYTGSPIREELLSGDKERGAKITGFTTDKPTILVIGGSTGSVAINNAVRNIVPKLTEKFQVIHVCGEANVDPEFNNIPNYFQIGYANEELKDFFALADMAVSRAGANTICEFLALRKPSILIPLPAASSRGDQILNAESFERQGFAKMLKQEDMTDERLLNDINALFDNREKYVEAMAKSPASNAVDTILNMILELVGSNKKNK